MSPLFHRLDSSFGDKRLICFPFAGGYSSSFRPLNSWLKDDCQMVVAEPPGHGTNQMPLVENFERLADLYFDALLPMLDEPFVLFGHSMGGLVAFRLAQLLEMHEINPKAVIISAVQPPDHKRKKLSRLDDDAFLDYVIKLGGIPSELAREREVLNYFLPAFRADFKALESYKPVNVPLTQTPVHIFNGDLDQECMNDAYGWKDWANQVEFHTFKGGHMFLLSETERVTQTMRSIISEKAAYREKVRS